MQIRVLYRIAVRRWKLLNKHATSHFINERTFFRTETMGAGRRHREDHSPRRTGGNDRHVYPRLYRMHGLRGQPRRRAASFANNTELRFRSHGCDSG